MLSNEDRLLLDIEAQQWRQIGHKETAIRASLDMSLIRYYQRLNTLLNDRDAVAYAPSLVNRLRRLRAKRVRVNSSHSL